MFFYKYKFIKSNISIILIILLFLVSCRAIYYNLPDLTDYKIFPYRRILADTSKSFHFITPVINYNLGNTIRVNDKPLPTAVISLEQFIVQTKTVAFIIIRNDTILYKKYTHGYCDSTIFNPMSITKAFLSALVGIAIQEGYIKSDNQYICDFLPELINRGFDSIKIKHLLKHTSGISYTENNLNPFCDNTQYYYSENLRKKVFKHHIQYPPGTQYQYSSVNSELLGLILERATKKTMSKYLETRIWRPIGMQYNALWSTDNNNENSIEKAFCCLNTTALDLAKFGRLYLKEGNWNGEQIINKEWVLQSTKRDTTDGSRWDYQYNFGVGPKLYESFFAVGLYGQLIYIYPKKNLIIIRICESTTKYNPPFIYYTITQIIDQL